jgi:hypothetical protein
MGIVASRIEVNNNNPDKFITSLNINSWNEPDENNPFLPTIPYTSFGSEKKTEIIFKNVRDRETNIFRESGYSYEFNMDSAKNIVKGNFFNLGESMNITFRNEVSLFDGEDITINFRKQDGYVRLTDGQVENFATDPFVLTVPPQQTIMINPNPASELEIEQIVPGEKEIKIKYVMATSLSTQFITFSTFRYNGSFTLVFGDQTTAAISSLTPLAIQTALRALSNLEDADVTVTTEIASIGYNSGSQLKVQFAEGFDFTAITPPYLRVGSNTLAGVLIPLYITIQGTQTPLLAVEEV